MYLLFPLVGAILSVVALHYAGPPKVHGVWQPLSTFLWLTFIGFCVRLVTNLFNIAPERDRNSHED